jgi:hypothetical protein
MPPKRKAAPAKQASKGKAKQPKQDGQKAVSHDIDIPIDEGFKEDGKMPPSEAQASCRAGDTEISEAD